MKAIDRFYEYLAEKNLKPTAVEKEIGLSNGYLSAQKKRNADMGEGMMLRIIDYCRDINPLWLLTGEGSMFRTDHLQVQPAAPLQETSGAAAAYYRMYKEKDEENKELLKENARLEERLRLAEKDRSDFKKFVEDVSTKSTLLRTNQDAPSAGAPLKE